MGPTQTGIVNAALAELGSTARIQSIDDGNNPARAAKAVWDSCMRTLLAEHPWNWAIRRAVAANPTTAPEFGFARAFTLPPDSLRWLPHAEDDDDYFEGREEGGVLLTDAEAPLNLRYISAELGERVALWPPYFVRAMELAMAERMAEPITQDESIKAKMEDKAEIALRRAKRKDGMASGGSSRRAITVRSSWLTARDRRYYPSR